MIYILSWTTKKHQKNLSRPLHSKLKKIQGLFKDLYRNLRTFQGKMEFKDFSRLCEPCLHITLNVKSKKTTVNHNRVQYPGHMLDKREFHPNKRKTTN